MAISASIAEQMERSSWIRRMFEIGIQMRKERGPENVFDFSLGNPDVEPPAAVLDALRRVVEHPRPHAHGYMPNAGFPEVRAKVAATIGLSGDDIIMTNGAAGALNTVLKAILDPGDEVIVLNPYFPEYRFYIENHGGRVVPVETDRRFQPDPDAIRRAITRRTKALILNSPNNPTGAMYDAAALAEINRLIEPPVLVLSDEPYRTIVYDGVRPPETLRHIERAVVAWSWSKAMAIPGERIGYLAIPPWLDEAAQLRNACTFANRILGFINAPAIWQWVVAEAPNATVPVAEYQAKRDLLCDALQAAGYELERPKGAYYVFPRTPIEDDIEFIGILQQEGILAVPGTGFGRPGYMRLSLTIPRADLERSLAGFARCVPINRHGFSRR
jgi:aspartate aminotransferase